MLKRFAIPFTVFITGACVLVIEVLAIRLLSPYFGNTIFTVSSVISVVLGALSAGYYAGGKLADAKPSEALFFGIIVVGGLFTIGLYLAGVVFLALAAYRISIVWGPLLSSLLLFFPQNFLLGMLSPFAIKLQSVRLAGTGIGNVSGGIFFWSTLGSIAGSLLTGFYLVPHLGVDKIMLGAGFLLLITGGAGLLRVRWPWRATFILLCLGTAFFSVRASAAASVIPGTVYAGDSPYQRITIYDASWQGRSARFLLQDRNSSAAEFLDSNELAYDYTKYYALYQINHPDIKTALMIGGGAYSVPKALLASQPDARIDVAEIDPMIWQLGKKYFGVPDTPRLRNITQDGRRFLAETQNRYDFIFSDAYASFYSTPEHLTTREFFRLAESRLSGNGVFIANVIGSLNPRPESFLLSEMRTFQSVFPDSYFFAVQSPDSTAPQNFIFLGYKNSADTINVNAPAIVGNPNPVISGLASKLIDLAKFNLANYPLLTDNYAPVDYLISKEFTNIR